jgi:hypothetical protein
MNEKWIVREPGDLAEQVWGIATSTGKVIALGILTKDDANMLVALGNAINSNTREQLADLCHEQWSGWAKYLFSKGEFNEDGTWTMPSWAVERWTRQMTTPYSELSEDEQESDRNEADRFIKLITEEMGR